MSWRLGLFQDSDFAGDLEDSKSTSDETLCVFGSHTYVPISWTCEKRTCIEIPRIDDEDIKSSTESANSTSLIHCIASVGNCEQVQTSVLNLIFQHANVAGVGNLSK